MEEKNIGKWPFRIIAIRYWAHLLPKSGGDVRQATEKINKIIIMNQPPNGSGHSRLNKTKRGINGNFWSPPGFPIETSTKARRVYTFVVVTLGCLQ